MDNLLPPQISSEVSLLNLCRYSNKDPFIWRNPEDLILYGSKRKHFNFLGTIILD